MRTTIFLTILLTIFVKLNGQIFAPADCDFWNYRSHGSEYDYDFKKYVVDEKTTYAIDTSYYQGVWMTMLNEFLIYENECYNDSVLINRYGLVTYDTISGNDMIQNIDYYSHPEPTFTGFIEYLERKYQYYIVKKSNN